MKRYIFGLIAAAASAPYLLMLGLYISEPLFVSRTPHWSLLKLWDAFAVGTAGLFIVGIPLLLLSWWLAFFLDAKGWQTWWQVSLGGMALGTILTITVTAIPAFHDLRDLKFLALNAAIGAICGWIYWRIAIKADV